mgnify:CR=1 FL=1
MPIISTHRHLDHRLAWCLAFVVGSRAGCLPRPPAYPSADAPAALQAEAQRISDRLEAYVKDWLDGKVPAQIPPELIPAGVDPKRVKDFLEEARRAGRLNHPNVVQVHDVCQVDDHLFLVMELMTGGCIADKLRTDGPLDTEACLRLLVDVGHALAYAESQRLVHRDVKPDNILVSEDGVYKLADLGIAAPIDESGVVHQVRAFGSAHYVAPEQAMGGTIDGRADIYALGASLYHLMTGKTMYEGTSRQIVAHHLKTPPSDVRTLAAGHAPALCQLVMQMVEKDPTKRPATGMDVAQRAQALLQGKPVAGAPVGGVRKRLRRPHGLAGGRPRGGGGLRRRKR